MVLDKRLTIRGVIAIILLLLAVIIFLVVLDNYQRYMDRSSEDLDKEGNYQVRIDFSDISRVFGKDISKSPGVNYLTFSLKI